MDERFLEQAEELTNLQVEAAIAAARRRESAPLNFDGTCNCGELVPQERVRLGYYRCLDCQTALEKKGRLAR